MPLSIRSPSHKFIIDENVHSALYKFLSKTSYDVKLAPKSASDNLIASLSIKEQRILVTNDEDFTEYAKDEVFSVVWLRITQGDTRTLLSSFEKLVKEFKNFSERMVILQSGEWEDFPLIQKILV